MKSAIKILQSKLAANQQQPFNEVIKSVTETQDFSITELYYDGWEQKRVKALLAVPQAAGTFPAIVLAHPFSGDNTTFLPDAIHFAQNGFVCLMIEVPYKRPEPFFMDLNIKQPETVRANYLQWVGDIIRGYDYLSQMINVDETRMGYVGRNLGASIAGVVTAIDDRIKATVFQAGLPRLSQFWQSSNEHWAVSKREEEIGKKGLKKLAEKIADFDFLPALPKSQCPNWLFQFGKQDDWISREAIQSIEVAANENSEFKFHEDNHYMKNQKTNDYLLEWLRGQFYQEEVAAEG